MTTIQTRIQIQGACVRCGKITESRAAIDHVLFTWATLPPGWLFLQVRPYADGTSTISSYRGVLACSVECAEAFTKRWCDT